MANVESVENLVKNFILGLESYQPRCRQTVPVKEQAKVYKFHCGKCKYCIDFKFEKGYIAIRCLHGYFLQSIICSKRKHCGKSPTKTACTKSSPCARLFYATECEKGCKFIPENEEIQVDWVKTQRKEFILKEKTE